MPDRVIIFDSDTGNWIGKLISNVHIAADAAIAYSKLALSGQLLATDIGSGQIASGKLAAGVILSAHYGAATIAAPHMVAYAISSGYLASGAISFEQVILSGTLTKNVMNLSGRVTATDLEPGTSIDIAEQMQEPDLSAAEPISSWTAVYLAQSGYVKAAKAESTASGTLPAIGIIASSNVASGAAATFQVYGYWPYDLTRISGQAPKVLFVGSGGKLSVTPPTASGDFQQKIGRVAQDNFVWLNPSMDTVVVT